MRSDDFSGWQEAPRGRRARRDPDDYGTEPGTGARTVREQTGEAWEASPGGDPYRQPRDYGDRDWAGEQDPYGRTDPYGSSGFTGARPYAPRGDYPSQPPFPGGEYPSQPPFPGGEYPSQPPFPGGEYPSQPPCPGGEYPSQPPYPGGEYPSQPPFPGRDYPSQPPNPAGGGGYGQGDYDDPYADSRGYTRPASRTGYDSQELYNPQAAFGAEPPTATGQAYQDQAGYGAGAYSADNSYPADPAGYGQGYDGSGARSGPLPAFAEDDQASWLARGDGASAARTRGAGQGHAARRGRQASGYQHEGAALHGPVGGTRGSGRSMDADEDRHSGFFAGYASNDDDHYGGGGGGRPRRGRGRGRAAGMIALIVVVVLLGGLGFTGYHFYSEYKSRHASYTGNGFGTVDVLVPAGATAVSMSQKLVQLGVIAAADPFVSYVDTSKNPTGLQPGEFKLHKHMGNAQAWAMLTDSKNRINSTVTIPDGLRVSKILPLLAKKSHIPLSDFQTAIKETSKLGLPSWANGNPEGFLYPATYDVVPGSTTALQILQAAVHQFNFEVGQVNLAATAKKDDFTELQIVTEASLLEGEVGPKYYPDVARTIDNRLKIGMKLQLDSTVAYATGHYTYNLSAKDRAFPSPYNTFLHDDLPPGPINSPSIAAIKAALHPASSSNDWIYFITVNKAGLTEFTSSFDQFTMWSNEAKQNGV
jgi:peptidoglycan lytic transglycosylase G